MHQGSFRQLCRLFREQTIPGAGIVQILIVKSCVVGFAFGGIRLLIEERQECVALASREVIDAAIANPRNDVTFSWVRASTPQRA